MVGPYPTLSMKRPSAEVKWLISCSRVLGRPAPRPMMPLLPRRLLPPKGWDPSWCRTIGDKEVMPLASAPSQTVSLFMVVRFHSPMVRLAASLTPPVSTARPHTDLSLLKIARIRLRILFLLRLRPQALSHQIVKPSPPLFPARSFRCRLFLPPVSSLSFSPAARLLFFMQYSTWGRAVLSLSISCLPPPWIFWRTLALTICAACAPPASSVPCSSFSRARLRPGGPAPVRASASHWHPSRYSGPGA